VLFDMDGTLVDTAPDLGRAANQVRIGLGMAPLPLDLYRPQASNGARGLLGVALGISTDAPDYETHKAAFLRHYEADICSGSRLFDGVAELLAALDDAGIRWGIVTNKIGRLTTRVVAGLGLDTRTPAIVAGDSTPNPKPAPDGLLLAASLLDALPAQCIYVGDDHRDILAGHAAGMGTIAAGWGYLGTNPDVASWGADSVYATPGALRDALLRRRAA
jgi:phosphoglycolate phosphatase